MAITSTPIFPQNIQNTPIHAGISTLLQLTDASATGLTSTQPAYRGGSNGSKIYGCYAVSTDTVDRTLILAIFRSPDFYQLGVINIPANSGSTSALPPINLLDNSNFASGLTIVDGGKSFIVAGENIDFRIGLVSSLTSGKVINIFTQAGDF